MKILSTTLTLLAVLTGLVILITVFVYLITHPFWLALALILAALIWCLEVLWKRPGLLLALIGLGILFGDDDDCDV